MEKKSLIPLVLILGLLTGEIFVKYTTPPCNNNRISGPGDNNSSDSTNPADYKTETSPDLTSWQEKWVDYESKYGLSFRYPKFVAGKGCNSKSESFFVPTKIFEDTDNQTIYIVPEYYYDENDTTRICKKYVASLDSLQKEASYTHKPSLGWHIVIDTIENKGEDIDILVKGMYGAGCEMESEKPWIKDGINEIRLNSYKDVKGNPASLDRTVCSTNYSYKILYLEKQKRAVSLLLGQECTFVGDSPSKCLDEQLVNSFEMK